MAEPIDELVQRWKQNPSPAATIALCDALRVNPRAPLVQQVGEFATQRHGTDVARARVGRAHVHGGAPLRRRAGGPGRRQASWRRATGTSTAGSVRCLLRRGDAERAEKVLERAIQLGARDPDAQLWLERARVFRPMQAKAGTRAVATEVAHATAQAGAAAARLDERQHHGRARAAIGRRGSGRRRRRRGADAHGARQPPAAGKAPSARPPSRYRRQGLPPPSRSMAPKRAATLPARRPRRQPGRSRRPARPSTSRRPPRYGAPSPSASGEIEISVQTAGARGPALRRSGPRSTLRRCRPTARRRRGAAHRPAGVADAWCRTRATCSTRSRSPACSSLRPSAPAAPRCGPPPTRARSARAAPTLIAGMVLFLAASVGIYFFYRHKRAKEHVQAEALLGHGRGAAPRGQARRASPDIEKQLAQAFQLESRSPRAALDWARERAVGRARQERRRRRVRGRHGARQGGRRPRGEVRLRARRLVPLPGRHGRRRGGAPAVGRAGGHRPLVPDRGRRDARARRRRARDATATRRRPSSTRPGHRAGRAGAGDGHRGRLARRRCGSRRRSASRCPTAPSRWRSWRSRGGATRTARAIPAPPEVDELRASASRSCPSGLQLRAARDRGAARLRQARVDDARPQVQRGPRRGRLARRGRVARHHRAAPRRRGAGAQGRARGAAALGGLRAGARPRGARGAARRPPRRGAQGDRGPRRRRRPTSPSCAPPRRTSASTPTASTRALEALPPEARKLPLPHVARARGRRARRQAAARPARSSMTMADDDAPVERPARDGRRARRGRPRDGRQDRRRLGQGRRAPSALRALRLARLARYENRLDAGRHAVADGDGARHGDAAGALGARLRARRARTASSEVGPLLVALPAGARAARDVAERVRHGVGRQRRGGEGQDGVGRSAARRRRRSRCASSRRPRSAR